MSFIKWKVSLVAIATGLNLSDSSVPPEAPQHQYRAESTAEKKRNVCLITVCVNRVDVNVRNMFSVSVSLQRDVQVL